MTHPAAGRLASLGIAITTVDVGASLAPYQPFRPLAPVTDYLGFDPDAREIGPVNRKHWRSYRFDGRAVVADPAASEARVYLTFNPTCSSTRPPDQSVNNRYAYGYRFDPVDEARCEAVDLATGVGAAGFDRIDWIKLDTQGTDLSILKALPPALADSMLAVDPEPGLQQNYVAEETFFDLHPAMIEAGFWLSDLEPMGSPRLSREVFDSLHRGLKLRRAALEFGLRPSPTAVGLRYLRSLEWLADNAAPAEAYWRLWAIAWVTGHLGYALDIARTLVTRLDDAPSRDAELLTEAAVKARARQNLPRDIRPSFDRVEEALKSVPEAA